MTLTYPNKSHRKEIIKARPSPNLAEYLGVLAGDGSIQNAWQVTISLNATKDLAYATYLLRLTKQLFGIEAKIRKKKFQNCCDLICSSTTLVEHVLELGMVRGNKIKGEICIPKWVMTKPDYSIAYVRGLIDTDGCLYIHRHNVRNRTYFNLGLCFVSHAEKLLHETLEILLSAGIPAKLTSGKKIYVYSASGVKKYLSIFGSNNQRIWRIYNDWMQMKYSSGEVA